MLNVGQLACFCLECMDDNSEFCETKTHVMFWRLLILEPFNVLHVHISYNILTSICYVISWSMSHFFSCVHVFHFLHYLIPV
jgi:hypothetical protein